MIAIEYHADLKEVQSDPALAALLSPDKARAPFDRLAWWQGLEQHCGLDPLLAVARDGDAITVLPLARSGSDLESLANWYTFRFRPVCSDETASPRLLAALATDLAGQTDRITLSGLPGEDGTTNVLEEAFRAEGWLAIRSRCDVCHVLPVNGRSFEEYKATLPGKLRTTLKRKTKKVDCEVLTRFDAGAWAEYEAIYAESWKPEEGSPDFLRAFAEAEGADGRLRLAVGRVDGEAVAAQMWTVEGNTAFIHKLAHRESAKPVSPGSVLSAALFRHVIDEDKVELVDFGTGDDPYKRDWMEEIRLRYRLELLRRSSPKNWLIFAKSGLRRLAGRDKQS